MTVLKPTDFIGTITWLGLVGAGLASTAQTELVASLDGVAGEKHAGATRASCSRVLAQYPKGSEIRNTRQFSLIGAEDLAEIERILPVGFAEGARYGDPQLLAIERYC